MPTEKKAFDFWYAVHNTQIVHVPSRALETFGETRIHYYHLAELPDVPGKVRVREGRLEAHKPLLITPEAYVQEELSGFGEQARQYLDFLKQHQDSIRILQYGYRLSQESFSEQVVTDSLDAVAERVEGEVKRSEDPFAAVIKGVDEDLSAYRITESTRKISDFVDELSNWYVRLGRERFWGKGMAADKEAAFMTLYTVLEKLTRLIAPYMPFMAEEIYQNIVRSVSPDAPESVHLCDFPVCDDAMIDADVERQMAAVETVVQLGRSCRQLSNMKVRQPLNMLYVSGADFGEAYKNLVEDELNVKNVNFIDDAGEFVNYDLKPNFLTLKKNYGRFLGKMRGELQKLDGAQVVAAFDRGETVTLTMDGTDIILNKEDVLVEAVKKEGFTSQVDGKLTVVLDTTLTPALIQEGYAREVISKLQNMRKDAGFDVTDRITVTAQGDEEALNAVKAYQDMIEKGVLAVAVSYEAASEGAFAQECDINGKPMTLSVKKA